MADECVFCGIVTGDIPSTEAYRDDRVMAFDDINPSAPVHVLVVPTSHVTFLRDASEEHEALIGHMALVADRIAAEKGVRDGGYRLTINQGRHAGQVVDHLHMHMLGGGRLGPLG
ncbi:MAG: HIT domain-containing protein [Dehalococcoidia bacterium]